MKILNHERLKIGIYKPIRFGKRRLPIHWKPKIETHRRSMGDFKYWKDDTYHVQHYFVTEVVQIFWLWFIIGVELPMEKLSGSKYVRYESTHFATIDETLNP